MLSCIKNHWHFAAIAGIVIVKNWFLEVIPFVARLNQLYDDGLFIRLATSIVDGNWLGDFNKFTLIKGPVYPMWVAFNYFTGMNIIHSQDLLFMAACLSVMFAVSLHFRNKLALVGIFAALYLNPVSFDFASISHAFRMVIYTSLTLLTFGALLGTCLRIFRPDTRFYPWPVLLGIAFSLFWYCREEGRWILPGILFVVLVCLGVSSFRKNRSALKRTLIGLIMIPASIWGATTAALVYMNWTHYNAPYVVEVLTPNFTRAYNAMLRLENKKFTRYFPVQSKTVVRLFEFSPKAAELQAFRGSRNFNAAHFIWAFRDAVDTAGYYSKGAQAVDQFYSDLADELDALCENNTVKCNELLLSDVPPWRDEYTREFPGVLLRQLYHIIRFDEFSMSKAGYYSYGDDNYFNQVKRLFHSRIRIRENQQYLMDRPTLFGKLDNFKTSVLQNFGDLQLSVRPILFILACIALVILFVRDILGRVYNPYTIFSITILGSILVLSIGLTVIELTAYNNLFRARHGALPLPPLFIVMVILSFFYSRSLYAEH